MGSDFNLVKHSSSLIQDESDENKQPKPKTDTDVTAFPSMGMQGNAN